MDQVEMLTPLVMVSRLLLAGVIGGIIGYERKMHQKAIGVGGMMLVAIGSATYMLLAIRLSQDDPASLSRALQGLLQGIGFLGGAVIFKGGTDVHGIKTAAAIWITGAIGLSIATSFWWLGVVAGGATALILLIADLFPVSQRQQETQTEARTLRWAQANRCPTCPTGHSTECPVAATLAYSVLRSYTPSLWA
jgi:putative Mg2+ transporter-C (MgtC) family protein